MPLQNWIEKTIHVVETLSDKEKVLGTTISKDRDADSLVGHKRHMTIDFLEKKKNATLNSLIFILLIEWPS